MASTNKKDISLCDILGIGSDFLFLPYEDALYVRMQPTSMPVLIIISVLTVYMTVVLAHNLEFTIQVRILTYGSPRFPFDCSFHCNTADWATNGRASFWNGDVLADMHDHTGFIEYVS